MRADFGAVTDACVLIPMPLVDLLLRLAETPRLYLPLWSEDILNETQRNLINKFKIPPTKAEKRIRDMKKAFPEAEVNGYQKLIPLMENDAKDRHVLAAAVRAKAEVIVTYNKKDFPNAAIEQWGVKCVGPSTFLKNLFDLDPAGVVRKLHGQAEARKDETFETLLEKLENSVPNFVRYVREQLSRSENFCISELHRSGSNSSGVSTVV